MWRSIMFILIVRPLYCRFVSLVHGQRLDLSSVDPRGAEHDTHYNTAPPSTQDIRSGQLPAMHMYEQGVSHNLAECLK